MYLYSDAESSTSVVELGMEKYLWSRCQWEQAVKYEAHRTKDKYIIFNKVR